jgi:hypothetical protein
MRPARHLRRPLRNLDAPRDAAAFRDLVQRARAFGLVVSTSRALLARAEPGILATDRDGEMFAFSSLTAASRWLEREARRGT